MSTEQNKALVREYNETVIAGRDMEALSRLLNNDFINHSAAGGLPAGREGMQFFFSQILHPAFADLEVEIVLMVAEGDKVTTRKFLKGTHTGPLMGIPATGKRVAIGVIDIFTVKDGQLQEHWGETSFASVIAELNS